MSSKSYINLVLFMLVISSCNTVRKMVNNDQSAKKPVTKVYSNEKREFINGIEVTLGTVTTTKHKTSSTATTAKKKATSNGGNPPSKAELEKANWLQIKYAIVMDMPAEDLTNIPLLELMDKWWGTRYCIGGSTMNCIDCSAFTQVIMKEVYNTQLPRTAQEQFNMMQPIAIDELQEGDLVFFNTGGRGISHVGIYIQNNKFLHASTSQGVTITDLSDKYWNPKFRGGGRMR
ncbi:C40 family peptidase [Sediminibacterium sp.]|uniref:C40 family peptidase n=1 Tax=Sediminibacterium sp. TaxID=1917865 RepID=UPI002734C674|nr:NlpC/P60 family protein [Sediminibacterium sp.]MDP3393799.1 NlpC/P60 family protein [Sediminibacterium sp.]MDP3568871.1 NlpC/P60 family protein [Sediminibacterium sp.]